MSGKRSATPDQGITVLYDGWSLVHSPTGAEALHLHELLALVPGQRVTPILALPGQAELTLPVKSLVIPTHSRLVWEQVVLPRQARRVKADLIHLVSASAPLLSKVPCVLSPTGRVAHENGFLLEESQSSRLRSAFGYGGLSRAGAVLWPADLPVIAKASSLPVHRLPPVVHPAFSTAPKDSFWQTDADSYAIAFGAFDSLSELRRLLAVWSWVAASLGEGWPLRVYGLATTEQDHLAQIQADMGIEGSIQTIAPHSMLDAARCLQKAGAILHLGAIRPWGDPVLRGLVAGRPIAAEESWGVGERVGLAAYLAPSGDTRALGAALLTLIVEESVAAQVCQAALERTAAWGSERFPEQLFEIYRNVRSAV